LRAERQPATRGTSVGFAPHIGAHDEAIDYAATDFTEVVGDLDAVLEVIGGDYPAKALEVLKPRGTLVATLPPRFSPSRRTPPTVASAWPASSSKPTGSA